jgi:hypothetical protein
MKIQKKEKHSIYSMAVPIVMVKQEGRGDGPNSENLNPKPRNYREIFSYKNGFHKNEIASTIKNGIPKSAMPSFSHLKEIEIQQISKYISFLQNQP